MRIKVSRLSFGASHHSVVFEDNFAEFTLLIGLGSKRDRLRIDRFVYWHGWSVFVLVMAYSFAHFGLSEGDRSNRMRLLFQSLKNATFDNTSRCSQPIYTGCGGHAYCPIKRMAWW